MSSTTIGHKLSNVVLIMFAIAWAGIQFWVFTRASNEEAIDLIMLMPD